MTDREPALRITKNDLEIQTFRSGGPGGQHQNKTESGVRIIHRASGAVAESRSERSQLQNRRIALERLSRHPKLVLWVKIQLGLALDIEAQANEYADREIANREHTVVEYWQAGKWEVARD